MTKMRSRSTGRPTGSPARRWMCLFVLGAAIGLGTAFGGTPPAQPPAGKALFLELGSVGCKPCEAMKPVMQAVRDRYGDEIDVVFYDVRQDRAIAREYGIRLIPTQIFLKPDGTEFFRHEGFFRLEDVEKVLGQMGIAR